MTDLGALGGFDSSSAQAINNQGIVVGRGGIGEQGHAFVYDPQQGMRFLEDMIPPNSGWSDLVPRDINNAGWIVGSGTGPAGSDRAFLMTPAGVIPAVSEYGAVAMTLLILTFGTIVILRARGLRGRPATLCAHAKANQPYLVKDINPAPAIGGFPDVYAVVNGKFLVKTDAR